MGETLKNNNSCQHVFILLMLLLLCSCFVDLVMHLVNARFVRIGFLGIVLVLFSKEIKVSLHTNMVPHTCTYIDRYIHIHPLKNLIELVDLLLQLIKKNAYFSVFYSVY